MMKKIIAFQKMLFRIFLSQFSNTKRQNFKSKNKKAEFFIFAIFFLIIYLIGVSLFGGLIGIMLIPMFMLLYLYRMICEDESIIFYLPLKKSFVVLNIYIFPAITILITSIAFFIFISLYATFGTLVSGLFGSHSNLPELSWYIAILQGFIIAVSYVIIYVNGLIISFFTNKPKIRIAFIIIFTAIYSAMTLYIYNVIPKDPKESSFRLANSLLLLSNSWVYVAIMLCVALFMTLGGIFISIRLNSSKRNLQNI